MTSPEKYLAKNQATEQTLYIAPYVQVNILKPIVQIKFTVKVTNSTMSEKSLRKKPVSDKLVFLIVGSLKKNAMTIGGITTTETMIGIVMEGAGIAKEGIMIIITTAMRGITTKATIKCPSTLIGTMDKAARNIQTYKLPEIVMTTKEQVTRDKDMTMVATTTDKI